MLQLNSIKLYNENGLVVATEIILGNGNTCNELDVSKFFCEWEKCNEIEIGFSYFAYYNCSTLQVCRHVLTLLVDF
jgi:hypothetical protein